MKKQGFTGIKEMNDAQKNLHEDIMALVTRGKYINMPADDLPLVFSRVYGVFLLTEAVHQGRIHVGKKK